MHEYFDVNGKPCIASHAFTTVITREPEWDEDSRGRAVRLAEFEAGLCPCGCGLPAVKAHDEHAGFVVDTFTCRARKAIAQQKRKDEGEAKKNQLGTGWDDGRYYYAVPHED